MKHVVKDVYVSDDGKREFEDAAECVKYDKFIAIRDLAGAVSNHRIDDVEFANFVVDNWIQISNIMNTVSASASLSLDAAKVKS